MSAEFDNYARDYQDLLKDPIRDRFAQDSAFFHARKWYLLRQILSDRFGDLKKLRWLDIGCGKGELLRFGRESVAEAVGCDPSKEMIAECADLKTKSASASSDSQVDMLKTIASCPNLRTIAASSPSS